MMIQRSTPSKVDFAVAIPTLAGSILSAVGAGFIVLSYSLIKIEPKHFRHTLIMNLAVADLILGINNGISGIDIIAQRRDLSNGPLCKVNGFVEQLATQSVDCSIFLIALTVFYVINHPRSIPSKLPTPVTLVLITLPWLFPLITSIIALTKHYLHPVSGNWCWIQARPPQLRYLLMHGWRFTIIIAVIAMGLYVRYRLKKQVEELSHDSESLPLSEIRKALLLSSYPIYYIVLWIPGIANRLAEATGHSIRFLEILQASTQFIGLANAVTFGWHEVRHMFSLHKVLEMLLGFILGD